MSPERKLDVMIAQWAIQALARLMLTIGFALGLLIVIGGDLRFTGAAYETALRYPYAPESWGIIVGTLGAVGIIASLLGRLKITAAALYLLAAWCLFFAHSFYRTATINPVSGTTGIPVYIGVAVASAVLGVVHWKSANVR